MRYTINSMYKIIETISSTNTEVFYLANTISSNEKVIVKANKYNIDAVVDKNTLTDNINKLKNIDCERIAKILDIFVDGDIIYTIYERIQGINFTNIMGNKAAFSQANVIKWTSHLLEIVACLHSVSGVAVVCNDIKPSDLVLTDDGIFLVDFDIVLALKNTAKEGLKREYNFYYTPFEYINSEVEKDTASDNTSDDKQKKSKKARTKKETSNSAEVPMEIFDMVASSKIDLSDLKIKSDFVNITPIEQKKEFEIVTVETLLYYDVAIFEIDYNIPISAIVYNIGAILYHGITGKKPKNTLNAKIIDYNFSNNLLSAIERAISKNAENRFRNIKVMRKTFRNLRYKDYRNRRYKILHGLACVLVNVMFFGGAVSAYVGFKRIESVKHSEMSAEYSEMHLTKGNLDLAVEYALDALPTPENILIPDYIPAGQTALSNALGIYHLEKEYPLEHTISNPSNILQLLLSDDGNILATRYEYEITLVNTKNGDIIDVFPTLDSSLGNMVFVDDIFIFTGFYGVEAYDISKNQTLWTGEKATNISVSDDGQTIATIFKDDDFAMIYNIDGELETFIPFYDKIQFIPKDEKIKSGEENLFLLNGNGEILIVEFDDGSIMSYYLHNATEYLELVESSNFDTIQGGFYNQYLALVCHSNNTSIFSILDTETLSEVGGFQLNNHITLQATKNGIFISSQNVVVQIDVEDENYSQTQLAFTGNSNIKSFYTNNGYTLAICDDDTYLFFDPFSNVITKNSMRYAGDLIGDIRSDTAVIGGLESEQVNILKREFHADDTMFTYDADFNHDATYVHSDGTKLILYNDRNFCIYDENSKLLKMVYFNNRTKIDSKNYIRTETDDILEVVYSDDTVFQYSMSTGNLLDEVATIKAEENAGLQVFYTNNYKIQVPTNGIPVAYDIETNNFAKELDFNGYFKNISQLTDYILIEYIDINGDNYGILLDDNLEEIAYLPNLAGNLQDDLIFDYKEGTIRRSKIYTVDELKNIANNYIKSQKTQ